MASIPAASDRAWRMWGKHKAPFAETNMRKAQREAHEPNVARRGRRYATGIPIVPETPALASAGLTARQSCSPQ